MPNPPPSITSSLTTASLEVAEFLSHTGRNAEARATYLAALELDSTPQTRIAFGSFLYQQGEFGPAVEQFLAVWEQAKRDGNRELTSLACTNLAALYRTCGEFTLAAQFQQLAMSCSKENGEPDAAWATDLLNRANDAIAAEDFPLAKELLRSMLLWAEEQQEIGFLGDGWGTIGVMSVLDQQPREAVQALWKAFRYHERAGDPIAAGSDLLNMASAFGQLGQWSGAVSSLNVALMKLRKANAQHLIPRAELLLEEATRINQVKKRDPQLN